LKLIDPKQNIFTEFTNEASLKFSVIGKENSINAVFKKVGNYLGS